MADIACGLPFDVGEGDGQGAGVTELERFIRQRGGFATRADLVAATSRSAFDTAVREGDIVWFSHGRYGVPELDLDLMTAHGLRAVLSHASAALWHGWEVKSVPLKTNIMIPRRRRLALPPTVEPHRVDLRAEEIVDGICTSAPRTLIDCLRTMPPDDALAIADSALRHGVHRRVLTRIADSARGPGRPGILRAATHADVRAANPFESCLRSIAADVDGLSVEPQRWVTSTRQRVRPDLVDVRLQMIIEAESFEWHGDRAALRRDARRYNLLVVDGWIVLRFSWEDVMFDREYVLDVLQSVVDARTQVRSCPHCSA